MPKGQKGVRMKKVVTLLLSLFVIAGALVLGFEVPAQAAAKVKLSKKSVTLQVGKKKTIKVKGTTNKVTWATSDKKVATVNSKGKITAKGEGTCNITATVGSKTLTCKVTVKAKAAAANTVKVGEISFPYDPSWTEYMAPTAQAGGVTLAAYVSSDFSVYMFESVAVPEKDFQAALASKESFEYIGDLFTQELAAQAGATDTKVEIFEEGGVKYGKATGSGSAQGVAMAFTIYFKLQDNNFIITMGMQMGDTISSSVEATVFEACKAAKK